MNREAINKILSENELTKSVFLGAYACDKIKNIRGETPYAIIVNTDNSSKSGSHWVLLYVTDQNIFFFDTFGRNYDDSEMFPADFVKYMKKYIGNRKSKFNPRILESLLGNACGQFCLYYLFEKCLDARQILKPFTSDLKNNDMFVKRFVKSM